MKHGILGSIPLSSTHHFDLFNRRINWIADSFGGWNDEVAFRPVCLKSCPIPLHILK